MSACLCCDWRKHRDEGVAASNTISMREQLSGRSIQIRKSFNGTWVAFLFPNGDQLIEGSGEGSDPVEAVVRMARKLQELPIDGSGEGAETGGRGARAPQTSV